MGPELMIIGWAVSPLIARVAGLVIDQFLKEGAKSQHKKLQKKLEKIAAVAELDSTGISSQKLKNWIWCFKDVVCDAEDVVDGFDYRSLKAKAKARGGKKSQNLKQRLHQVLSPNIFKKPLNFFKYRKDVHKLTSVIEKFNELDQEVSHLLRTVEAAAAQQRERDRELKEIPFWRLTTSANKCRSFRGRYAPAVMIFEALTAEKSTPSNKNLSILPIIGAGGVGKTELARLAYNSTNIPEHFDMKAWVCVFRSFSIRRIMIEIIESFAIERPADFHSLSSQDEIQKILKAGLKDKRFLIVLDDVWEESPIPWDNLCASLRYGKRGSKIVVTTQLEKLANMVGTEPPIKLDVLEEEDEYWALFEEYIFGYRNSVEHRALTFKGKQIAKKFGGSPLAASMIGRELKLNLNEWHWDRILHKELGMIDRKKGDIVSVLEVCYQHLPVQLKQCYLSCALFPKNYCFEKEQLLQIWTALGFAHSDNGEDSSSFVDDLASRSFFINSRREKHGSFTIHAVLHELADLICDGEFCRLDGDRRLEIPAKARHLHVTANNLVRFSGKIAEKKSLRSLVVDGTLSSNVKGDKFMASLKAVLKGTTRLRLLMLSELPGKLPGAISDLRHLRYLEFPCRELKKLPKSLGMLYHLRYLNLKNGANSKVLTFPKEMDKESRICWIAEEIKAISSARSAHGSPPNEMGQSLLPKKAAWPDSDNERAARRRLF